MPKQTEDQPLTYERPAASFATRRQFRILFALLLLNLCITLQTAYAPGLRGDLRSWWASYQSRRESRALHRQAAAFTEPPSKVVWDENPQTADALLQSAGYHKIRVETRSYAFLARWPSGAAAIVPDSIEQWHQRNFDNSFANRPGETVVEPGECALVLLHGFKAAGGRDWIVFVYVQGKTIAYNLRFPNDRTLPPLDREWSSAAMKELKLVSVSCMADRDGSVARSDPSVTTLGIYPEDDRQDIHFTWMPPAGGRPEQIRLDTPGRFRFYAGQPDPANASQFTIPYDFDQQHGIIHGRILPDGTVQLSPDTGVTAGTRWYPAGLPRSAP